MTLEVLEGTYPGTVNGVSFLMRSDETTMGNAIASYEFINSPKRVVKKLGKIPPKFKADIFVHGTGQEFWDRRDALVRALGAGVVDLVHPFWGGPFNVSVGEYTVRQSMDKIGIANFSVPFEVSSKESENPETPESFQSNAAGIRSAADAALIALQAESAASFGNNSPLNYESSVGIIDEIGGALNEVFGPIGETVAAISEYAAKGLAIQEQASFYADNPLQLFAAVADGITGIDGLTTDAFAKFTACKNLFDYGDKGTDYDVSVSSGPRIDPLPRTLEDAERETNSQILSNFMKAGTGIEAFAQSGTVEYENISDLESVADDLDDQFKLLADIMTKNDDAEIYNFPTPNPDYSNTYNELRNVYIETQKYLEQQRLTTPRIETIEVQPMPASVLSYRLYGDSTRAEEILELNDLIDNMVVSGEIKVLSA